MADPQRVLARADDRIGFVVTARALGLYPDGAAGRFEGLAGLHRGWCRAVRPALVEWVDHAGPRRRAWLAARSRRRSGVAGLSRFLRREWNAAARSKVEVAALLSGVGVSAARAWVEAVDALVVSAVPGVEPVPVTELAVAASAALVSPGADAVATLDEVSRSLTGAAEGVDHG